MKTRLRIQVLAAAMAATLAGSLPAVSQTATSPTATAAANPHIVAPEKERKPASSTASAPRQSGGGQVYLLRGLLNIFSLGMDDLASKLQKRGVNAIVYNHAEWQSLADDIAAKYKAGKHGPVVLIGHSLGADAVMIMAEYLGKKGVPVALVVPFDGTGSFAASSNVSRVMNLTQRDYAYMKRGVGFRGELQNIDVSKDSTIDHITIDKSGRLHNMVVGKVLGVLGRGGGGGGTPKTAGSTENTSASSAATSGAAAVASPTAAPKAQ
jgi:pimeloyl-ACP methyl ester carboxylesterase